MGVVAGPTAVESDAGKPDWSPVPPRPGRSPRAAAIRRVLGAAAAAVLVWVLAHPALAVGIVVVMLVVTVACELSPRFARWLQHLEERFQHWVGAVLSLLLMGLLQYLVFAPIWFLLKLFRRNPLDVGAREHEGSAWSLAPRRTKGGPLYKRSFAYERVSGAASRGVRVRAAVGVVALLVVVDIGAGALLGNEGPGHRPDAKLNLLGTPSAAAGRDEPWRVPLGEELDRVWTGKRYDPYLGWTLPDLHGRYVNVSGGVRESRQTTGGRGRPVEIFFFGGSSMFGLFQRDGHTIPSEFSRLAERDGLRLKIVNYGRLAYVNWQEQILMDQLASGGAVPDIAVFYDGFNELLSQFQLGPHLEPSHVQAAAIAARLEQPEAVEDKSALDRLYEAWGDVSAVRQATRDIGTGDPASSESPGGLASLSPVWAGDQGDRPERRGRYAEELYARGVDQIGRTAASYGFDARFFWQPSIYTKQVDPGERSFETWLGADPTAWRAASREARARLGPRVTDLGGVLNQPGSPVMYDFVHTNERGARVSAAALYKHLRPDLLRLAHPSGS